MGPVRAALDVCCGTGAALGPLVRVVTERVTGIDASAGMLAIAGRAAEAQAACRAPAPRVELVRGDALDMPFETEFDAAVSVGAFGHILEHDEPRFVASIHRALVGGGRFLFVTHELPSLATSARLCAEAFNAIMRVRDAIYSPKFVMYYLTFLWPDVRGHLLGAGFTDVEVVRGAFPRPYDQALLVIARKAIRSRARRASGTPRNR